MNKDQLIDAIASDACMTKAESKKALDAAIKNIACTIKKGDSLNLPGFGKLEVHQHKKRSWKTKKGKIVTIPAHKTVFFHIGEDLNACVNR